MPANSKRMYINGPSSRRAPKGFLGSTYETLTSSENASAVRSIAIFGVSNNGRPQGRAHTAAALVALCNCEIDADARAQAAIAFLASPWGEMLLPPQ
ncbi:hypothetical protein OCS_05168 [Ophiocordyceps sinensis CO18]|uniref:Uncharacterized protein n=1 Tax=Ophiocordyceps sinensis (strain Co18 / CGMCC 3.14243) TaxID=911162 RepID=T5ABD9_OPHSC|nr:hypothetical protein OCS_05168 [Ophiocordyceps sinensis CO18]